MTMQVTSQNSNHSFNVRQVLSKESIGALASLSVSVVSAVKVASVTSTAAKVGLVSLSVFSGVGSLVLLSLHICGLAGHKLLQIKQNAYEDLAQRVSSQ